MNIQGIEIRNVKAFSRQEVPLRSLSLMTGLNGSGKSTVLQCFALLRQSFDSRLLLTSGDWQLNGDLVAIGEPADLLFEDAVDARMDILLNRFDNKVVSFSWGADVEVSPVAIATCDSWSLFRPGFQYLRADRIVPETVYPKSPLASMNPAFLGPRGEFTADVLDRLRMQRVREVLRHPNDPEGTTLLGQVNAWMQEFSPGVRVEPEALRMTDLMRLTFSFRGGMAKHGRDFRPTNVGFGLSHALPVITALLAAEPGQLLIIENPEAQLHPRGQATIGTLLAKVAAQGVQIIVETHSDHVLNGIRVAVRKGNLSPDDIALNFFARHPGQLPTLTRPKVLPDGRLSQWPHDFFDQWDKSLDQLTGPVSP